MVVKVITDILCNPKACELVFSCGEDTSSALDKAAIPVPNSLMLLSMGAKYLNITRVQGYIISTKVESMLIIGYILFVGLYFVKSIVWLAYEAVIYCDKSGNYFDAGKCREAIAWEVSLLGGTVFFVAAIIPLLAVLTIFCMLFLIADTIHRLGHTWISRFERLRNVSIVEFDEVNADFKDSKQNVEQFKVMKDHLGRDASERYLFICKWTMEVGRFWKAFIMQILIVPTFGLMYFLYMVIETVDGESKEQAFLYFGLFFITMWCIACPLYAVSYSNSAIEKMRECVNYSSPDNFSAVGGRSNWL
jgi:hypothetical protein